MSAVGYEPGRSTPAAATRGRATFPAGSAVALLGLSFLLTRMFAPLVRLPPALAAIGVLTGTAGAVLAAVAAVLIALEGRSDASGPAMPLAIVRAALAGCVALLVAGALQFREPPMVLQWAGLAGAVGTVVLSLGHAVFRARRGMYAAAGALLALLVGELIELVATPVFVMSPQGSRAIAWLSRLQPLSELCAFGGALLAVVWAVRASLRAAGPQRTRLFAPMPAFVALVLLVLAASIPGHVAIAFAQSAFGARFDLFLSPERPTVLSLPILLFYLLVPDLLVAAAVVSVAGIGVDGGASPRRALGWIAVLLAGFSALRLAGPMDPIRLVTVTLGALLLDRAATIESSERNAPA